MLTTEQDARIVINRKLSEAGWLLEGNNKNVLTEQGSDSGILDYLLLDRTGRNLAVVEAKRDSIDPYMAKNQARGYAEAKKCRYVFLANSEQIYFWDTEEGDASPIERFISAEDLQRRHELKQARKPLSQVEHDVYIAGRKYQVDASNIIAEEFDKGKKAFLLEMATGSGKTRVSAAIIKRFLKARQVERVLFVVDRIELAKQAMDTFQMMLGEEYGVARYRPGRYEGGANIIVATIQSLNVHFKDDFTPGYFDLVINDEAHRSIYGEVPRQVIEYFQAIRIGLTATPKDFLKNVDIEKLSDDNPRKLEYRVMRDTYKHFGCEPGVPTFRYTIQDGVRDKFLVPAKILRMVSLITKEACSDEGWDVEIDGESFNYKISQLEKKVLIPKRNELLCLQFLQNALKSPDGAIGKSIVFAVSQNHAVAIAKELNKLAPEHNGKFAEVITSRVQGASDLAKQFRKDDNFYPRIAVSVDMLSTGFDCPEVLNVVLARPIASPTSYIQIKGRGTRKYTFPDGSEKTEFLVHDFCEVVDFFEEKYDYDAPLPISLNTKLGESTVMDKTEIFYESNLAGALKPIAKVKTYKGDDLLTFTEIIEVGPDGEKVDRMVYITKWERVIKDIVSKKPEFELQIKENNLSDEFEEEIRVNAFDKPKEFFNEHNLSRAYKVMADLLDFVKAGLGMAKLPTEEEQLIRLVDSIRVDYDLNQDQSRLLKLLVSQLSKSPEYIRQFEEGNYQFLDRAPFSNFGGAGGFIIQFGDKIKPIFEFIKESSVIRLSK
jgi:type I restriction enzyme R subunit